MSWGISENASGKEKLKAEMNDFFMWVKFCLRDRLYCIQ